jgi:hypothetical protein
MQNETKLVAPAALSFQTQEIVVSGFNPAVLQMAAQSLTKQAEVLDVNLSMKNWDTSKQSEFKRCVYLGSEMMPAQSETTGEEKLLETAFFMDEKFNIWYKAAYQFVKAVKMLPIGTNFTAKFKGVEKIGNGNKAETFEIKQLRLI